MHLVKQPHKELLCIVLVVATVLTTILIHHQLKLI
jgi:hypothetical protein